MAGEARNNHVTAADPVRANTATKASQGHRRAEGFFRSLPPELAGWRRPFGAAYRAPSRLSTDEETGELIVEIAPEAMGEYYALLDERPIEGQAAYVSLAKLSEDCWPGGLGGDALRACWCPSPDVQDAVKGFVSEVGLLDWGGPHDCLWREGGRRDYSDIHRRMWNSTPRRLGNCVGWILQEALVLRRAMKLWGALRRLRVSGDVRPLKELWKSPTVFEPWLFDDPEVAPPGRWEKQLRLSIKCLDSLINAHVCDAHPANTLVVEKWRRGGRSVRAYGFRRETDFGKTPLSGLWLQFYHEVLRGSESGRACANCGALYTPRRVDQRFCTPKCGSSYRMRKHRLRQRQTTPEEDRHIRHRAAEGRKQHGR